MRGIVLLTVCFVLKSLICITEANWYGKRGDDDLLIRRILYNRQPMMNRADDSELVSRIEAFLKDLKDKTHVYPENSSDIFSKKK